MSNEQAKKAAHIRGGKAITIISDGECSHVGSNGSSSSSDKIYIAEINWDGMSKSTNEDVTGENYFRKLSSSGCIKTAVNDDTCNISWDATIGDAIKEPELKKGVVTGLTSGSTVVTGLTSGSTVVTGIGGTAGNVVKGLKSGTGIVTGLAGGGAQVVTGLDDGRESAGSLDGTTVITGISSSTGTDGDVVTDVSTQAGNFLTSNSSSPVTVVTGVSGSTSTVLTGCGSENKAVTTVDRTQGDFLSGGALTVVTGLSSGSSGGGSGSGSGGSGGSAPDAGGEGSGSGSGEGGSSSSSGSSGGSDGTGSGTGGTITNDPAEAARTTGTAGTVVTGCGSNNQVITALELTKGYFLSGSSSNQQPVVTDISSADNDQGGIEYVSNVQLSLSNQSSPGAVSVVTAVQCEDDRLRITTLFLSLVVTKKKLLAAKTYLQSAQAVTDVTDTKTTLATADLATTEIRSKKALTTLTPNQTAMTTGTLATTQLSSSAALTSALATKGSLTSATLVKTPLMQQALDFGSLSTATVQTTTLKTENVGIKYKQANCAALPEGSPYLNQSTAPGGSHYVGEQLNAN